MSKIGLVTLEAAAEKDAFARSHSGWVKDTHVSVRYDLKSRSLVYFVWVEDGWVMSSRDDVLKAIYGD